MILGHSEGSRIGGCDLGQGEHSVVYSALQTNVTNRIQREPTINEGQQSVPAGQMRGTVQILPISLNQSSILFS